MPSKYFAQNTFFAFLKNTLENYGLSYIITDNSCFINTKNSTIKFLGQEILTEPNKEQNIIIWEDQWLKNSEIIKNRIIYFLGKGKSLPARVCKVKKINKIIAKGFLEKNHLQGILEPKISYGLYLPKSYERLFFETILEPEVLVAVMCFSGKRMFKTGEASYELIRQCSLGSLSVIGGFSKLFKAFIKDYNPDHVMTYIDLAWGNSETFSKLSFTIDRVISPLSFDLNPENERITNQENGVVSNAGSAKLIWRK